MEASVGGAPNPQLVDLLAVQIEARQGLSAENAAAEALDVGLMLAGHGEGRALRDIHKFLLDAAQIGQPNSPFKKDGNPTLITIEAAPRPAPIAGLEVRIAGPRESEIKALQVAFDKYIKQNGLNAEALLAAYADTSVRNLSSIVSLVSLGGKRILFTGDARGDKIIAGLDAAGLLVTGTLAVDVLKVPHHGSSRSLRRDFFQKILAGTYVFSGNGRHSNPDRDPLDWLTDVRGKDPTTAWCLPTRSRRSIDAASSTSRGSTSPGATPTTRLPRSSPRGGSRAISSSWSPVRLSRSTSATKRSLGSVTSS